MASGGGLQKYGSILQVVGAVLNFILPGVGEAVGAFGRATSAILQQVGGIAIGAGTVANIAGPFVTPLEPDTPSQDRKNSATYTFGRAANPQKGDAVYPVPFGRAMVRGPVLAAFSTPKGIDSDEDFSKVVKGNGETVSMLVPMAVGRIHGLEEVLIDGDAMTRTTEEANGDPKLIGTGNGSRTTFKVDAKRVLIDSVEVYQDGTLLGWTPEQRTASFIIQSGKLLYDLDDDALDFAREVSITVNGNAIDGTGARDFVLIPKAGEDGFRIFTQFQWLVGATMRVTYYRRGFTGGTIQATQKGFDVVFVTAPSSGSKITCRYKRSVYPGVTIHERRGSKYQLPIPGFSEVRQTRGLGGEEITSTVVTFTTDDEVDDVRIAFTTGGPFLAQDSKGRRNPAQANFQVRYKKTTDSTWTTLPDPAGAKTKPERKNANEFRIVSESFNEQTFHMSIRGVLDKLVRKRGNTANRALRSAFTRSRYDVEIKRTNNIKNATNAGFSDRIYALSFTEVRDILLSWPGIALFGFHGVGSKKLSGGFPTLSTVVTGLADVEKYTGSAWTQDDDAHKNPVWAAVEAWTNAQWGGGREGLTKADNVDADSAKTAADWCDASVGVEGRTGYSEVRARLDATIDTRQVLFPVMRDMLLPAQVIPCLQGARLRFVIDQAVDLSSVPTYTADPGTSKRIVDSLTALRQSRSAQATELEALYWSEDHDFEPREVFVPSVAGTTNRVRKRVELFGVSRRTQAVRVATFLHGQATNAGPRVRFRITTVALRHEAGDVFGVTDTEAGVTTTRYFRCTRVSWPDTGAPVVEVEAQEYIAAHYAHESVSPATTSLSASPANGLGASYTTSVGGVRRTRRDGTRNGRIDLRRTA